MNIFRKLILLGTIGLISSTASFSQKTNVIDQVVWMVGDEPILLSDIQKQKQYYESMGQHLGSDAMCIISEQIAIQKLFLNQAKIDSIQVNEMSIAQSVNHWIEQMTNELGSREKLEEYFGRSVLKIREEKTKQEKERYIVKMTQDNITKDIKISPSDVTKFYESINKDSLPFMPTTVEVQIITMSPKIETKQIDEIKEKLRDYTNQVNSGKMDFAVLAQLYSQDKATALKGGEMGFLGKAELEPEFANVAFTLPNNKKVSRIVRTAQGYNIIQLIDKRNDLINVRHILLRPEPSTDAINQSVARLDSISSLITKDSISFENAAQYLSFDEDTRNSNGLMVNNNPNSQNYGTSMFEMQDLPQEIAKHVDKMKPTDISQPFTMMDKNNNLVVAIVKLKRRNAGHRANLVADYQILKDIVLNNKKTQALNEWIHEKQKETYVKISPDFKHCKFMYPGWVKE